MASPSDGGRFSSTGLEQTTGKGRGWQNLGECIEQAAADYPALAGVVNPARRARSVECQSIGELLRGCERPAGELLQQCQAQLDREQVERAAGKLNAKMVADGRPSLWVGGAWAATMADAIADGVAVLALWRAGMTLARGADGADVLAVADSGGVCAAWVKSAGADGSRSYRLAITSARIAWRSVVASVARDTFGESVEAQAAAADWVAWYQLHGAGVTAADLLASWRNERRQSKRLAAVESMRDKLASGRGRRGALADKVKQAAVLMLAGVSADEAATAAGFNGRARVGRGGAVSAADRLAAALRRAGLCVTARRGRWAQDMDEFTAAQRRGAAVDLARTWTGIPEPIYCSDIGDRPPGAAEVAARVAAIVANVQAARQRGEHPLAFASSGQGAAASEGVAVDSLPALPAQLRRAVRALGRRKLRGVLSSVTV